LTTVAQKSRNCLTIIEWRQRNPLSTILPPILSQSPSRLLDAIPDTRFMFQVFRKRFAYIVFLAYEKEKCRQDDVFMVNDLCLGGRSVKVIEWEMLSALGTPRGRTTATTTRTATLTMMETLPESVYLSVSLSVSVSVSLPESLPCC